MRIAVTEWNQRVSPVFDVARAVKVLDIGGGVPGQAQTVPLPEAPADKLGALRQCNVEMLICGAVSREVAQMLAAAGIAVHSYISGEVEEVVQALAEGRLADHCYAMPGCCRRRGGQGRGGGRQRCGRGHGNMGKTKP